MESCYRYSAAALAWLCVFSILVVFFASAQFNSFVNFSASKLESPKPKPTLELQRIVSTPDKIRAVSFSGSTDHQHLYRPKNTTVIRKRKKPNREQVLEQGLARARASIRSAATARNVTVTLEKDDYVPVGDVYRNPSAFYQSYVEMERRFKVYVYTEGELPIVHDGPCKEIYTIEGRFIHEMEHGAKRFRTNDPRHALVYFMPFSVAWMVKYIYKPLSYNVTPLKQFVSDYVKVVSTKYPFWNRTHGADHFMLACHDWGPHASQGNSLLYTNSIRVLCNANTSEGFNPQKDVSLPEIRLNGGFLSPKLLQPPLPNASRPHLSFFAGGLHGPIRPFLLQHWKGRDDEMQVFEYLPKDKDYYSYMLQSKFCLCPSGYEVASPRIVEAIYSECVPVILSERYVLPFSDVLRWEAFSVQVQATEIPRLKEILLGIPEEKYRKLQEGVRAVRRHFMLNQPSKRFDMFHMILHSIWLRRINARLG
ncbi:probable glycosyltransferase At5g25310 [Herrania umbratica]|uniref:Probable glycosyltransferase At5g25310 n=1 Tax=Herrania umbratica TaxID=108875 RepID=A0A6J0ZSM3_9ROSI|nr:probable glycosyltransferase At5g25310 [Herrania umbratica]